MEEASIGGIAGEIGDPKKWTSEDTFRIIISCAAVVVPAIKQSISFGVANAFATAMTLGARGTTRSFDGDRFIVNYDLTLTRQGGINKENFSSITSALQPFMNNDEYDAYIEGISSLNDQTINTIQATLNSTRTEHDIYGAFVQYNQDVVEYSVAESTSEEYFQRISDLLNERANDIAHMEKVDEIIHWTVFASTIAGSIAISIATGGAAAGSTAAIIRNVVKYTCALAGVANAVSWSCTNFEQNTVILSQCVNQGTLKAEKDSYLGGFAGVLHEYGIVSECLNLGSIEATDKSSYGQITTTAKSKCEIEDCILAGGKSWNGYDIDKKKIGADMDNIYYWADGKGSSHTTNSSTDIKTKEDLANPDTYKGLSLGDNGNHWIMSQYNDLTLPVPYRSRFME